MYSFSTDFLGTFKNFALSLITLPILSPLIVPGHIALTRILNFPNSIAKVFVTPTIAHLLAAYGDLKGNPNIPAVEDKFIIAPFLFFLSIGIASFVK